MWSAIGSIVAARTVMSSSDGPQRLLLQTKRSCPTTARATLSRRRVASRTACPGVQKRVSKSRLPVPSRARYVIHWPDLSRCISSSGLFEVPFLLPLYRIDRTSLLTTWRCSETALLPLTLGYHSSRPRILLDTTEYNHSLGKQNHGEH